MKERSKLDKFEKEWVEKSNNGTLSESERATINEAIYDHESVGNWIVSEILRNLKYK